MLATIIIAPLSFGAFPSRLTRGSELVFEGAIEVFRQQEDALIVWATSKNFSEDTERAQKTKLLEKAKVTGLWTGNAVNTSDEAEMAHRIIYGIPNEIYLVTDRFHVWGGAREVWQKNFPHTVIKTVLIPTRCVVEPDHPAFFLRSVFLWIFANAVRYCASRIPFIGHWFLRKLKEPML